MINKLPIQYQIEPGECGLACLSMILRFYAIDHSYIVLRRQNKLPGSGISVQALVELSEQRGLKSSVYLLNTKQLSGITLPAILHWNDNHYVVLKSILARGCIIHDPNLGIRQLSMKQLENDFTGIAVELIAEMPGVQCRTPFHIRIKSLLGFRMQNSLLSLTCRYIKAVKVTRQLWQYFGLLYLYILFIGLIFFTFRYCIKFYSQHLFLFTILLVSIFSVVTLVVNRLTLHVKNKISIASQNSLRGLFAAHLFCFPDNKWQSNNSLYLLSEYELLNDFSSKYIITILDLIWYIHLVLASLLIIAVCSIKLQLLLLLFCIPQIFLLILYLKKRTYLYLANQQRHSDEAHFLIHQSKPGFQSTRCQSKHDVYLDWSRLVKMSVNSDVMFSSFSSHLNFIKEFVFVVDFSLFILASWYLAKHNQFLASHFYVLLFYRQIYSRSFAFVLDKWSQLSSLFKYLAYYTEFIELYSADI